MFEAYQMAYMDVMKMPVSRRHRFIKIRESIVDKQNGKGNDGETFTAERGVYTGLNPKHGNMGKKS